MKTHSLRVFMKICAFAFILIFCGYILSAPAYAAGKSAAKKEAAHETKKDAKKDKDGAEKDGEEKASKEPNDTTGGRFSGDPVYVHMDPFVLPIITQTGNQQIVTLLVSIEVTGFETADAIHTNMPRVKDAIVRSLYGGLSDGDLRNGKIVNINKVKTRAINAVRSVIGKDDVLDVLVQGIAQRLL